jgi:hypothetical protein
MDDGYAHGCLGSLWTHSVRNTVIYIYRYIGRKIGDYYIKY